MLPIICTQNSQIMTLLVKFENEILGVQNFCICFETSQDFTKYEHFFMQPMYIVDNLKFYMLYDQILLFSKNKLSLVSRYS